MDADQIELSPEAIEAIARRVAELLEEHQLRPYPSLVDAAELARLLGVKRDWVYEHASRLGAVRLGDGSGARLRFDPEAVIGRLPRVGEPPTSPPGRRPRRRPGPRRTPRTDVELLPLPGQRAGKRAT